MDILNAGVLKGWLAELSFCDEAIGVLTETVNKINNDPELTNYFKSYYKNEVLTGNWKNVWDIQEPDKKVHEVFGECYTLFYLVCYLNYIEITKEKYKSYNIPKEIYISTLKDISVWLNNWRKMYGYWCMRNLGWIWRHLDAELFRIGRLQYQLVRYSGDYIAFKKSSTGTIVVFSTTPISVNNDGNEKGAGGRNDDIEAFKSTFYENRYFIKGTPITPYGKVLEKEAKLLKTEWIPVLSKNDHILEIHIPRAEHLSIDDCKASYEKALLFYNDHFKIRDITGLACHTWMFTPQLEDMLSAESNIIKFQREFYLLPNAGNYQFMWNFVFDEKTTVENAPQDTYLRRKLLEYVKDNKLIFDTKGICMHNYKEWGNQPYKTGYNSKKWEHDVYECV